MYCFGVYIYMCIVYSNIHDRRFMKVISVVSARIGRVVLSCSSIARDQTIHMHTQVAVCDSIMTLIAFASIRL